MKIFATVLGTLLLIAGTNQSINKSVDPVSKQYVANYENVLGTSLELKITAVSPQQAERAEEAVIKEVDRLSAILSSYDQKSEFNCWLNKGLNQPIKVSKELFELLGLFNNWKNRSHGALNPSAAVAINLWKDAERTQMLPTIAAMQQAVHIAQLSHYKLDTNRLTATRLTDVPLILNTFAKSYIINSACDAALATAHVAGMVVNIGGDLMVKGDVVDPVHITDPQANAENDAPLAKILIRNKTVATSGNYRRGVQIGNKWYAHIVDPRTARPVDHILSATVIAPNATDAGALATAFNILTLEESKRLAATVPGVEYLIVAADGKVAKSAGFNNLLAPQPAKKRDQVIVVPVNGKAEKTWDRKFELSVSFHFNAIEGNTHRPFVAIWVEDANKTVVRNLALWYNKPKWIPDLRNWYRINSEKFKANKEVYASVTGATRSPGKYTLKWDGKNDSGAYVLQGNYVIIIETAKEHGTDEILRQPIELRKAPKKITVPGNVEFSNVTFDFHKK